MPSAIERMKALAGEARTELESQRESIYNEQEALAQRLKAVNEELAMLDRLEGRTPPVREPSVNERIGGGKRGPRGPRAPRGSGESLSARILAYLGTVPEATSAVIREGMGLDERESKSLPAMLARLKKDGKLHHEGARGPYSLAQAAA